MTSAQRATGNGMASRAEKDGTALRDLLLKHHKRPSDLARACRLTPTSINRYLHTDRLSLEAQEKISYGLIQMNIDPLEIFPPKFSPSRQQPVNQLSHEFARYFAKARDQFGQPVFNARAVTLWISQFSEEQLPYIVDLLEAATFTKIAVLAVVQDRMSKTGTVPVRLLSGDVDRDES